MHSTIPARNVIFQSAESIRPRVVDWLWKGWLAIGKLHILAGAPGEGKTTIAMSIAAAVSSGGSFPDGTLAEESKVIIWSGEDDPQDTLLPRLIACGANVKNCMFIKGVSDATVFDPATDLPILAKALQEQPQVRLIIFDPVVSLITGDSHKNAEVRRSLEPVVKLANEANVAVLGITHFGKSNETKNMAMKVIGSVAFTAVSRAVLVVGPRANPANSNEKMLVLAKSNLSKDKCGVSYKISEVEIQDGIACSRIDWGEAIWDAQSELADVVGPDMDSPSELSRAISFLENILTSGPKSYSLVHEEAEKNGLGSRTIRRASEVMGLAKTRVADHWQWSIG